MAFSTKHYYPKPIIPPITSGISLFGIGLSKFNARTALIVGEPFQLSTLFYYKNDPKFAEDLNRFVQKLEKIRQEYIHEYQRSYSPAYKANLEAIDTVLDKLEVPNLTRGLSFKRQGLSENVATTKELQIWLKKTFKQRKRKIQSIYQKKEYFEFYSFLNVCNDFLKTLGEQSLQFTNSLNLFFEIGSKIDWFLLNITDCSYHQSSVFKKLFSSHITLNNDLVSVVGAFSILKQQRNIELYLSQEQSFIEKIDQYKKLFHELLITGNRIIDLETMNIKAEKDKKSLLKEIIKSKETEETLRVINSMHEIAVDRKIQDID